MKITPDTVNLLTECIWVTFNFKNFEPLLDSDKFLFDLVKAKEFGRKQFPDRNFGLADFKQASLKNAMWDNL